MPDYDTLEAKTEAALATVILNYCGAAIGPIFLGQDPDNAQVPSTMVHALRGPELQPGTGIHWVFVTIEHRSSADLGDNDADPTPDHNARVAKVRDAVKQDMPPIVTLLNGAGVVEFTAVDVFQDNTPGSHGVDTKSRWIVDTLQLRIVAAAASI